MAKGTDEAGGARSERSERRAPPAGLPGNPEIPQVKKRRRYTAEYKLQILEEAERYGPGELGVLLRREGLYNSTLCKWREWRDKVNEKSKTPPPEDPRVLRGELRKLERENQRLKLKLRRSEGLVALQKKAFELLEALDPDEESSGMI